MDDRVMIYYPVRIPVRNFAMVPTKCPNMFSGTHRSSPLFLNLKINTQTSTWNPCNITILMVSGKM